MGCFYNKTSSLENTKYFLVKETITEESKPEPITEVKGHSIKIFNLSSSNS